MSQAGEREFVGSFKNASPQTECHSCRRLYQRIGLWIKPEIMIMSSSKSNVASCSNTTIASRVVLGSTIQSRKHSHTAEGLLILSLVLSTVAAAMASCADRLEESHCAQYTMGGQQSKCNRAPDEHDEWIDAKELYVHGQRLFEYCPKTCKRCVVSNATTEALLNSTRAQISSNATRFHNAPTTFCASGHEVMTSKNTSHRGSKQPSQFNTNATNRSHEQGTITPHATRHTPRHTPRHV